MMAPDLLLTGWAVIAGNGKAVPPNESPTCIPTLKVPIKGNIEKRPERIEAANVPRNIRRAGEMQQGQFFWQQFAQLPESLFLFHLQQSFLRTKIALKTFQKKLPMDCITAMMFKKLGLVLNPIYNSQSIPLYSTIFLQAIGQFRLYLNGTVLDIMVQQFMF